MTDIDHLIDWVAFYTPYLSEPPKPAGDRKYNAPCPFHKEGNPSWWFSTESSCYKCEACGESGNATTFLQKMEGLTGAEAWAELRATIKPDRARIIFSWGGGWDHVSVSFRRRTPIWDEMCEIKRMFFRADETVLQFHPREEEYVNCHPYCLHLWRKQGEEAELPPGWMIAPTKKEVAG